MRKKPSNDPANLSLQASQTCRKAIAAAVDESSDVLSPLVKISISVGRNDDALGAPLSHFE